MIEQCTIEEKQGPCTYTKKDSFKININNIHIIYLFIKANSNFVIEEMEILKKKEAIIEFFVWPLHNNHEKHFE